jgi:hypothetical protein
MSYFLTAGGREIHYKDIAQAIHTLHPALSGKHIFEQLSALNLREALSWGSSPNPMPFSFTEYLEPQHDVQTTD